MFYKFDITRITAILPEYRNQHPTFYYSVLLLNITCGNKYISVSIQSIVKQNLAYNKSFATKQQNLLIERKKNVSCKISQSFLCIKYTQEVSKPTNSRKADKSN